MSSWVTVCRTAPGYVILLILFLLGTCQLAVLIQSKDRKRNAMRMLPEILHFVLLFTALTLILDFLWRIDNHRDLSVPGILCDAERALFSLPWLIFAGAEVLSGFFIFLHAKGLIRYRRTHLSQNAVKETVDYLPVGIGIGELDGTPVLVNLKMNELAKKLIGSAVYDMNLFRDGIRRAGTEQNGRWVVLIGEEAWVFAEETILVEDRTYLQILASETTEQYRLNRQLSAINTSLKEAQERIKEIAAHERSLAAARESMKARMTVHNHMGNVLLSGKYYLDHPDSMEETELLNLLLFSSRFLMREPDGADSISDGLLKAIRQAKKIGVTTVMQGQPPENVRALALTAEAIEQCAANTVRHAGGDRLNVVFAPSEAGCTVEITNNGRPPSQPVVESGGLSVLRKMTEEAGGVMKVESEPVFRLKLELPE